MLVYIFYTPVLPSITLFSSTATEVCILLYHVGLLRILGGVFDLVPPFYGKCNS